MVSPLGLAISAC